ncbi:hypothetical protein [Geodermatophilus nigrescens]|uniref:T/G mismatch-specific endonuclease n=1 Tax=Geodermatophilus nigrescens TaxID=1070870 RepID=A0A1M5N3P6_9ACTN|nr:hypothetical protein [Geodermatophilus nigrescens]SHG84188.1 T/G mismatch-specific endonuclease [Geodermatophilus nigrescens]
MPPPLRPERLRGRVFRGADAVRLGLLTPAALRSSAWRRLYRGVYADAALPDDVGVRVRGALLLMPPAAVLSGRTAAWLHGAVELADTAAPVDVSVPTGVRFGPVAGLRVRQVALPSTDVVEVRTRRCTSATRTALDLARDEPLAEAVVALDVLLARDVVTRAELQHALAAPPSSRGIRRARRAVELADPRAESPQESRLRVLLALAGLTPVPQYTVRDAEGGFVARVDLAFPDQRLAVEYDGAWHGAPQQLARDRRRLNRLTAAGWRVVFVTAADLRDPEALVARVVAALRS